MTRNIGIVSIWELGEGAFAGTEHFIHNLGTALEKDGHSVICISPAATNNYQGLNHKTLKINGISTIDENILKKCVKKRGAESAIKLFSDSLKTFEQDNPEIDSYIINSPFFAYFSTDKKTLFVLHDNPDEFDNYLGKTETAAFIRAFTTGIKSPVVTPSEHYQKIYGRVLDRDIVVIPHALNPRFAKPRLVEKNLESSRQIRVIIPSRLEPTQKGQDIALNAIAVLEQSLRNRIHLTLTGLDTPYIENQKMLLAKGQELGIELTINKYDDILVPIQESDLVLLPSRFESFGYAAQETIALGKRVILSDIPTYLEIGAGAVNVSYFHSGDHIDLSSIIKSTIETGVESLPASEWFNRYSYEDWANRYLKILS